MQKTTLTIFISSFYIAGIIAYLSNFTIIFGFICLIVLIAGVLKDVIKPKYAVIIYLFFAAALLNCSTQIANKDNLYDLAPSQGEIKGTVISIPTTNINDRTKFYLKVDTARINGKNYDDLNSKTIVSLQDTKTNYSKINIGDTVKLQGQLREPLKAVNPSQFDYKNYLKYQNTFTTFYVKGKNWKIISTPSNFSWKFLQKLNHTRQKIINIHKEYLKSPNIEILGGIVFGDDAINPPIDIRNSFINSGLLHILAASGMNVSIIFGIWYFLGTRLRLNYRLIIFTGAILVGFYTLMTGMGASVLRAALMIEFVLLGKLIDRNADGVALLFLVALILLIINPAMIMEVGFQLSFIVTFALMYNCPPILSKIENKYLEFAAGTVMIPIVAQLWAAPIQMFYFNNFATYSIFANILISPFIVVISFLGFISSMLALIPMIANKICMVTDFILNPFISGLVNISNFFSELPNALLITPHPSLLQIILYYSALTLIGALLHSKFKHTKLLIGAVCLFIIFGLSLIKFESGKCEIIAFSVGNADSFLIKTPNKKHILIDTGKNSYGSFSPANAIINKYLKDNGIKKLDLLIITHYDQDHAGGAMDILKQVKAKQILTGPNPPDSNNAKKLVEYMNATNQNYSKAQNGKTVIKEKNFEIKTFVPEQSNKEDDNESSVITLLSYKDFDMLFMADASYKSYSKIKPELPDKIEVIKIGHHGAYNTVTKAMTKNLQTAIISTGPNSYGHPNSSTIDLIIKSGTKLLRTDSDNAIKISTNGLEYAVYKYIVQTKRFQREFIEKAL